MPKKPILFSDKHLEEIFALRYKEKLSIRAAGLRIGVCESVIRRVLRENTSKLNKWLMENAQQYKDDLVGGK